MAETVADVATANLSTYLSDHMAGSAGGVELAERLIEENPGNEFFENLLREINEDQDALQRLMDKVGASDSSLKKAGVVAAEKVGTALSGSAGSGSTEQLGVLREVELLAMGITGKLCLWGVLEEISDSDDRLSGFDFAGLTQRARTQLQGLQDEHRRLGRKALLR